MARRHFFQLVNEMDIRHNNCDSSYRYIIDFIKYARKRIKYHANNQKT